MMRRDKRLMTIVFALLLSINLFGCTEDNGKPEFRTTYEAEKKKSESQITIGLVVHNLQHQFMASVTQYMKEELKEYENVSLVILDSEGDNDRQKRQLEYLLAKKVDAIILNPNNPESNNEMIKKIKEKNIPLVAVNMRIKGETADCYIGTDESEAGVIQGFAVARALSGKGDILVIKGFPHMDATIKKHEGLMRVLNSYPGIRVLDEKHGNWEKFIGLKIMEDWMKEGLKFDAIVSQNDEMALGALTILEKAGLKTFMIGTDAIPEALEAVKEGRMNATIFQDARSEAKAALESALKLVRGQKVDPFIKISYWIVTPENVDEYINETYYLYRP